MLVEFNVGKTQSVLFDCFNNCDAVNLKINSSFIDEKPYFKTEELCLSSKLDWGCYIASSAKNYGSDFFLMKSHFIPVSVTLCLACKTFTMPGLLL